MKRTISIKYTFILGLLTGAILSISPAVAAQEKIAFEHFSNGSWEIFTVSPDGTNPANLTNHPAGDFDPDFSPDGSKIVFLSSRDHVPGPGDLDLEVYVMNANGTNQIRLTNFRSAKQNPEFSPDGSKIVFTSRSASGLDYDIFLINADGTNLIRLTNNGSFDAERHPTFSPDGNRIAFSSDQGTFPFTRIVIMNVDGSNRTILTNNAGRYDGSPAFSPDGSRIAFRTTDNGGRGEIAIMNPDGTNQVLLTNSPLNDDDNPAFSADGSKLVFRSFRGTEIQIFVMNIDGSGEIPVGLPSSLDDNPSWGGPADSDGDGIPNSLDNCPTTPNPGQEDFDADGMGNACDADDDNDTYPDTIDAFPLDPTEWLDTDLDGIGNNADPDDDNDQQSDVNELACGSNPLDAASVSPDNDADHIPDCVDPDDDNDGVPDTADNCPLVFNPDQADFDLDGIGDTCDAQTGPPRDKDQCKEYGWQRFDFPRRFINQGDCIQFVLTGY